MEKIRDRLFLAEFGLYTIIRTTVRSSTHSRTPAFEEKQGRRRAALTEWLDATLAETEPRA
jgi:hypothetical protein